MKTKLLLLLTFLSLNLVAQEFEECVTPTTRQNIDYGLLNQDRTSQQPPNTGPYCIDVFFHIIRDNNGNGGFNGNLDDVISLLNLKFNPINIFVNNVGSDEINNSNFSDITIVNINNHEGFDLENTSNNPNAINIYLVDSINGNQVAGFAFDIISTNLVIINSRVTSSTMPHELGHCINLYHTHHGTFHEGGDPNECAELIDGSNGLICGDYIPDTPADPRLYSNINHPNYNVNTNCEYLGNDGYNPNTHNIMSYSHKPCRDHFTEDQGQRMRDALKYDPILQEVVSNSCTLAEITTDSEPTVCRNASLTTFTIENADPPYNWTTSSNIEIVGNSNGNSILVKATNNVRNSGWIEVSSSSTVTNIDVWVNEPLEPSIRPGWSDEIIVNRLVFYQYDPGVSNGSTSYSWELPAPFDVFPNDGQDHSNNLNWWMRENNGRIGNFYAGRFGNSGFVKVRGVNKCGLGDPLNIYAEVCDNGNCNKSDFISVFPNSANGNFKIDLKESTSNQFYIYLSDKFSNLVYSGQCGNVDKTINTLNLLDGIYYLKIIDVNGEKNKIILINH